MQKSNVVRIMKKEKPWELQRYALLSFKFRDVDKNLMILATDQQIEQTQGLLHSLSSQQEKPRATSNLKSKIFALVLVIVASYATILWDLMQLALNPIIFVSAFSIAVACSLMLGKILSQE